MEKIVELDGATFKIIACDFDYVDKDDNEMKFIIELINQYNTTTFKANQILSDNLHLIKLQIRSIIQEHSDMYKDYNPDGIFGGIFSTGVPNINQDIMMECTTEYVIKKGKI